jgi:hypothetical protein
MWRKRRRRRRRQKRKRRKAGVVNDTQLIKGS